MTKVLDKPKAASRETATFPPLTARDRCDAPAATLEGKGGCGAQAFVRAVFNVRGEATGNDTVDLIFCNHHAKRMEPALVLAGAQIIDESDRINTKPTDTSRVQGF